MTRLQLLPEAKEELRAAAEFYESEQRGLGRALLQEVRRTCDSSRRDPKQVEPCEAKFVSEPSRVFPIASTIEQQTTKSLLLPLVIGDEDPGSGVSADSHIT
jgi:hypothetical protein